MCTVIWKDYPNAPVLTLLKAKCFKWKSKVKNQASGLLAEVVNEKLSSTDLVQEKSKLQNSNSSKERGKGLLGFWMNNDSSPERCNKKRTHRKASLVELSHSPVPWSGKGSRSLTQKVSQIPWWKQTCGPGPRPCPQSHRLQMQVQGSVRQWSL